MIVKLLSKPWVRKVLILVVWEALVVALAWFLYKQVHWGKFFSDTLFVLGSLELMIASVGMITKPYGVPLSGFGVIAAPVQPSERELREQMVAEFTQKRLFAQRLAISGVITILLAVVAIL